MTGRISVESSNLSQKLPPNNHRIGICWVHLGPQFSSIETVRPERTYDVMQSYCLHQWPLIFIICFVPDMERTIRTNHSGDFQSCRVWCQMRLQTDLDHIHILLAYHCAIRMTPTVACSASCTARSCSARNST